MATDKASLNKKLLENLLNDLRNLSNEAKRKNVAVKDASENVIIRIRTMAAKEDDLLFVLTAECLDILQPLVLGCETKNPRIVHICIGTMQRLITHETVNRSAALTMINCLWSLMESGMEELKLLQTIALLLTTNSIVQGEALARGIVLCFRLYFAKDTITANTASATVRQLVDLVFERCAQESKDTATVNVQTSFEELKVCGPIAPKSLQPFAADAYLLFQDLIQLVNADQPFWLNGLTEMTRTFGLELVESVLMKYPAIFFQHREFNFLLKERVCPLAIKLFSPNIKYRQGMSINPQQAAPLDKPYFPISLRLLRVVSILIQKYYTLLVTESEIFLSLLVKFLDMEKPNWQRCLALEVLYKLITQPDLIRSFCQFYDMKPHSTKIFYEILHSLDSYVLSLFSSPQSSQSALQGGSVNLIQTQGTPPALLVGMPIGPGMTPQPGFLYRGIFIPLNTTVSSTMNKSAILDMLDKLEPPQIAEGYGISLAYASLLEIIRTIGIIIDGNDEKQKQTEENMQDKDLYHQLITSSWSGLLTALFLLLEASTDETATENILKAIQSYTSVSGRLNMTTARDAFITSLCKASLPPHYTLTILNQNRTEGNANTGGISRNFTQDSGATINVGQYVNESEIRQQVVAVGTPLPTASLPIGAQQGPVVLTAKNLQCMRSILGLAHCHGIILGTAWHLVLTTVQHLVWILGLKPSTGGSLKAGKMNDTPNTVITTAVMADLPVLSAMLSRLFESSQYLDDVALHHLIDALCKLSQESMELAYTNREPSLFAVAKLLETGLVNLCRVEILWRPITNHLLEVSQHPHIKMREWGAEAVTMLVKSALSYKYETPLKQNSKLQTLILQPLQELSNISQPDIRQKQLESVLQILHNNGESLSVGWPCVISIIGAISDSQPENLVRVAFQGLQLIVAEFLSVMPSPCLQLCVNTAAKFGSQNQELNISLTAIGLLWNISDYFYQNRDKICDALEKENSSQTKNQSLSAFDQLWMCLFACLGDLCVDARPAVRKSAGQTLFSTISAQGSLLAQTTWQTILWQVLFPLLEKVRSSSFSASTDKSDLGGNILIHHSRNTAQKQWAETQVLTLSGVARVFNTKRDVLLLLGDFSRAWALLLEFIETSALSKNNEVSLAALKSFQEILQIPRSNEEKKEISQSFNGRRNDIVDDVALWSTAWKVWYNIGIESTRLPTESYEKSDIVYVPTQLFLTTLVQIFPALFQYIASRFIASDFQKMSTVFQNAVAIPVYGETTPFIIQTLTDFTLTPLQECILHTMEILHKAMLTKDNHPNMLPLWFNQLLIFVRYACQPPSFGRWETKCVTKQKTVSKDWISMNFVPFAEKSLEMVMTAYQQTASYPSVVSAQVLQNIIKTLQLPLSLKYKCPSQTTWKLAITCLLNALKIGLYVARQHEDEFQNMWKELSLTLEEFLFSNSIPPKSQSLEEQQMDEAIDCQVIQVIREEILPYSSSMPKEFILKIMALLNRGSIHSATNINITDSSRKLREEFSKSCFETLLQFSFIDGKHLIESDETIMNKLAVTSLLQRFEEVIKKFVEDERLNGKCPLPRHRMAEISFVLKAISTLTASLKKVPVESVDSSTWTLLINLYPHLVECTTSMSSQVCKSLKEALYEYKDLLSLPSLHKGN